MEVELTMDELAEMLGKELELPRIEPKGDAQLTKEKAKYDSIRRTGPNRCDISSEPTCKRCGDKLPPAITAT